jgi:hypothetical protein
MPVDTSMYGMIKPIDVMGSVEGGMRMRDLIDERKRKSAIQGAYKQGMQVGPDGKVAFDHSKTASALAQGGYGQEAYQAQQQGMGDQQKQMELAVKNAQYGAQVLGAARNQDEWNMGLQQLQNNGMDASKLPAEFSPQNQKFLVESAMSLSDRLSEQWKQKDYNLRERALMAEKGGKNAPAGYRFTQDGSLEAIPGGPADAKVGAAAEKSQKQKEMAVANANLVNQDIGRAMDIIDNNRLATGGEAALVGKIPGTAAHNLDRVLDSVKANSAFDKLQAMREASPTGGALGAVSEKEMALLQAAVGSLDKSLPKEMIKDNLKRVSNLQMDIIHGPGKGPKRHQLSFDEDGRPRKQQKDGSGYGMDSAVAGENKVFKTNQIEWAD